MKDAQESLGSWLQSLRESRHLKQQAVAMEIGCSDTYISKIEQDKTVPSVEFAAKLEGYYHLKSGTLMVKVLEKLLAPQQAVVRSEEIVKSVVNQLKYHPEDVTLLTEEDWRTLRVIIEPLVGTMLRQRTRTSRLHHRLTNKFIFVIEDELKECHVLLELLHKRGFRVDYAYDGQEALKRILNHREDVDLILLDLRMPRMDGTQFINRLHKLKLHPKILVITAYPQDVAELHLQDHLEIEGFVTKPFNLAEVANKVEKLLGGERVWRRGTPEDS